MPETRRFRMGCTPSQDASHHQDYDITFLVGDPYKPSFATVIWWLFCLLVSFGLLSLFVSFVIIILYISCALVGSSRFTGWAHSSSSCSKSESRKVPLLLGGGTTQGLGMIPTREMSFKSPPSNQPAAKMSRADSSELPVNGWKLWWFSLEDIV